MNVVITGASKGIGYELAKLFAMDTNNKVVAIARNSDLLNKLKSDCHQANCKGSVIPLQFDISDHAELKKSFKAEIQNHIPNIDILINNAAILINKNFSETSVDEIYTTFNLNLISPSIIIQELIPMIKKGNIRHVVNISSMGGFQGSSKFPGLSFYSSSKAALAILTECLAEECKEDHIYFNSLALGAVNTEMLQDAFPGYKAPVNPDQMAQYIFDFATKAYRFFNGKIIPVSISTP